MSQVYFAGDLHLDHKNICNFRPQFNTMEEHNQIVMDNILSTVTKRDKLYLMGDIAFSLDALELIKSIPCQKVLVCGNHEINQNITMKHLVDVYDSIHALTQYKGYWLTHCPIHPQEIRGRKGVIHGHMHYKSIDNDGRYVCVSLEQTDYKPIKFEEVAERFYD